MATEELATQVETVLGKMTLEQKCALLARRIAAQGIVLLKNDAGSEVPLLPLAAGTRVVLIAAGLNAGLVNNGIVPVAGTLLAVVISFPLLKFWIAPEGK